MKIKVLGTGTTGDNSTKTYLGKYEPSCMVYTPKGNILVDLEKEILSKSTEEDLLEVTDVFITHAHKDVINGIPVLNKFLEENGKFVTLYSNHEVIKTIKLRYSARDYGNFNLRVINLKIKKNQ